MILELRALTGERELENAAEVRGRVVLMWRGGCNFVEKVRRGQAAGAVGVVLVDDGRCESDLNCGRIGSARLGGFAPRDDPSSWRLVKIPSVLVSQETGKRIRRLMPLEHFEVPKLGTQWVSPRSAASHKRRRGARPPARAGTRRASRRRVDDAPRRLAIEATHVSIPGQHHDRAAGASIQRGVQAVALAGQHAPAARTDAWRSASRSRRRVRTTPSRGRPRRPGSVSYTHLTLPTKA